MTKAEKTAVIDEIREKLATSPNFYLVDGEGMTVEQTNNFRRLAYQRGIEYKVYKNKLIQKALEGAGVDYADFAPALKGMSGVLFAGEAMKAPANLLKEFHKKGIAKPVFKGASIDASFFVGADQLDALTKLKSKQELIGEVIGLLQSPAKNVISALKGQGGKIAGIVKTLSERPEAA